MVTSYNELFLSLFRENIDDDNNKLSICAHVMCRHIPVFISSSLLTIIKESLHVNKYIGEGGQLLLILEKLSEIVSNGLCVVVL